MVYTYICMNLSASKSARILERAWIDTAIEIAKKRLNLVRTGSPSIRERSEIRPDPKNGVYADRRERKLSEGHACPIRPFWGIFACEIPRARARLWAFPLFFACPYFKVRRRSCSDSAISVRLRTYPVLIEPRLVRKTESGTQ